MTAKLKMGNYDEFGCPFIIVRAQKEKKVLSGSDVVFSNIMAAKKIVGIMKTSLGPKGMDKMMIDEDADIIVTNDGATILDNMDVDHEVAKIMVDLAKTQDQEAGDGTTSVVVLAGALLEQAELLLRMGIHPIRITDGFELAAKSCLEHLNKISDYIPVDRSNPEPLIQVAMTALASKIVKKEQRKLAEVAVQAVINVADFKEKQVNLNWVRVLTKNGKSLEDTQLIDGVTLDRSFHHVQMSKEWENSKIALLSCALEVPKTATKIKLEVDGLRDFKKIAEYESKFIQDTVDNIRNSGANIVVCLNAIDSEINHLLLQNGIAAIQRAIIPEMDALARATGAKILPLADKLSSGKLGFAGKVRQVNYGGTKVEDVIIFEKCRYSNVSTILLRGSNPLALDEAKRSVTDALNVLQNVINVNQVVCGGGAAEISCALAIAEQAHQFSSLEQYSFMAFSDALENIPLVLAENCGYSASIDALTKAKVLQIDTKQPIYGIDCTDFGNSDMKEQHVFDTLVSKKKQIILATQMVKMIMKIDEIRVQDKTYGVYPTRNVQQPTNE